MLEIRGNPLLTDLSFLSSLRTVSGACNIDPPSLLDSAPANVQQACDP